MDTQKIASFPASWHPSLLVKSDFVPFLRLKYRFTETYYWFNGFSRSAPDGGQLI
jgi:hypothetical protein